MQIVDEDFLELLNSLLTSGRVPGLFITAEMDRILEQLHWDDDDTAAAGASKEEKEKRGDGGKPKSVDYESAAEGDCRSVIY